MLHALLFGLGSLENKTSKTHIWIRVYFCASDYMIFDLRSLWNHKYMALAFTVYRWPSTSSWTTDVHRQVSHSQSYCRHCWPYAEELWKTRLEFKDKMTLLNSPWWLRAVLVWGLWLCSQVKSVSARDRFRFPVGECTVTPDCGWWLSMNWD